MPCFLKQSTAVDIAIGPFLDDTDGKTAETALTISQADVRLKKNNGAWAQVSDNTAATHEENGWYEKELDATDTNTLGILIVAVHESGALPVWREFMVVPANVYDSLVSGSDTLDVQVTGIGNDVITAASIAANAIDAGSIASDAITAAKIADNAITAAKIADGAIDSATFAAGAINAAAIAADAITDAKVASDVTIASVTGSVGSVTGAVGSVTAGVTLANGAHGGSSAVLTLSRAVIHNTGTGTALDVRATDAQAVRIIADTGDALEVISSAGNGDAIQLTPHGTGVGLRGSITGNITGNLSGSVGSVTAGVTLANGAHGGAAATLTMKQVEINNAVAGAALILGSVDAECIQMVAATGDCVTITSNGGNGDAIQLNPNGTGVGIRGSITGAIVGNITGNLSGSVGSVTGAVGSVTAGVTLGNVAHGGAAATLTLKQAEINNGVAGSALILSSADSFGLEINSAGADAVRITSTGGNGDGIELVPHGTGVGIRGSITGALVGNITGNLSGSVGSVTGAVGSVTAAVTVGTNNDKTGYRLSATGVDDVWDEAIAGHLTAGTTGAALNGATAPTVAQIDAQLSATHGAGAWGGAGGSGAFAITVTVNDGAAALQNVNVGIYDGATLSASGTTNASGQATFSLNSGTYTVNLVKAGYTFTPVTRTVTGNQAGTLVNALSMTAVTISAPSDPSRCTVAGYIKDSEGNALSGVTVNFKLVPESADRPVTANGNVVSFRNADAATNGSGLVSIELIRTDELDQDCSYTIQCTEADLDISNVKLESATKDIAAL